MVQVNACDLRCPKKTMMALKYKQDMTGQSNPLGRLTTSIGLGIRSVSQMARATATCPSRDLPDDQWSASPGCIAEAQNIADGMLQVNRSELTEHESATLIGIRFRSDPPSITE